MNNPIELSNVSKKFVKSSKRHDTLIGEISGGFDSFFSRKRRNEESFWALRDASFSVKEGEILGIVGENGSGKSTLLRIIGGIITPTSGMVNVNGSVSSLLEVGSGFHPDLTGRENIFMNGALLGMPRREVKSRLDEIIAFSGIGSFIDSPVKHYSSGMFLRLGFSIAAHLVSDIILIDEVLAVGDTEFQYASFQKIRELTSSGKTIIIVSHGMNNILSLCTEAMLLDSGQIVDKDSPFNIVSKYHSRTSETIDEKLKGEELHEFTFPADPIDGISGIVFQKAVIQCNNAVAKGSLFTENEISVGLYLTLDKPLDGFEIMLQVNRNHESQMLATSTGLFNLYPKVNLNQTGSFRVTCSFPKYFFNKGLYSISVCLKSALGFHLENKDVLRFFVDFQNFQAGDFWFKEAPIDVGPIASWAMNPV